MTVQTPPPSSQLPSRFAPRPLPQMPLLPFCSPSDAPLRRRPLLQPKLRARTNAPDALRLPSGWTAPSAFPTEEAAASAFSTPLASHAPSRCLEDLVHNAPPFPDSFSHTTTAESKRRPVVLPRKTRSKRARDPPVPAGAAATLPSTHASHPMPALPAPVFLPDIPDTSRPTDATGSCKDFQNHHRMTRPRLQMRQRPATAIMNY